MPRLSHAAPEMEAASTTATKRSKSCHRAPERTLLPVNPWPSQATLETRAGTTVHTFSSIIMSLPVLPDFFLLFSHELLLRSSQSGITIGIF